MGYVTNNIKNEYDMKLEDQPKKEEHLDDLIEDVDYDSDDGDQKDSFDPLSKIKHDAQQYESEYYFSQIKEEPKEEFDDYKTSYMTRADDLSRDLKEDGDEWDIEVQ